MPTLFVRKTIPNMNNPVDEKKLMHRRIIYVVLTFLLLGVGGTLGWKFLAGELESRLHSRIEHLASQGKVFQCNNQRVEGFPFRVGLFCDDIVFSDNARRLMLKAGKFRSAAQFYQPGFVVGELDGPAKLELAHLGGFNLRWKLARSSSKLSLDGIKRISASFEDFSAGKAENNSQNLPDIKLSLLELHLRAGGDDPQSADIEAVIELKDIRVDNFSDKYIPMMSVKADGVIADLNKTLKSGRDLIEWIGENGLNLQVNKLELGLKNGGSLLASGPVLIDRAGLVSAKLMVEVTGVENLVRSFSEQNPQLGKNAELLRSASMIFAQGAKNGKIRLAIQISKGNVSAGFIPLGVIPPLY